MIKLSNKLYHYSAHPITELRQNFHDLHRREIPVFQKPHGVWFSVEDFGEDDQNWKSWCEGERFRLEALKYKYAISLSKGARILYMSTTEELEAFSLKYQGNDLVKLNRLSNNPYQKPYIYFIDWERVMLEYDGIIIAPYNWQCRLMNSMTSWYYGWDCSSGCIWNMKVIKSCILESIMDTEALVEKVEEGMATDSLLASLVPLK
jgi:hypothetical protein